MEKVVVMSVGGSLINPGQVQVDFLKRLKAFVESSSFKFIIICGGGSSARIYQSAGREFGLSDLELDEVGIKATVLNAELVRHIFGALPVQQAPKNLEFKKVLVAAGWKPGCSTDFDAVLWAKKCGAVEIVNLSNTDYVYTKDPKKFSDAEPLKSISWKDYRKSISSEWSAGLSTPFDPVASKAADKLKLKVFAINGQKLEEVNKALSGQSFIGSVIG